MRGSDYHVPEAQPETPAPTGRPQPWETTSVVGQPLPRVDAYDRLSGTAVYPSDVTFPDMLYGAILRCPHAHARVVSVDTSRAEAMPGVRAVLSNTDPEAAIPWPPGADKPRSSLFDDHCLYDGEEVAAVAAKTPQEAWEAVHAIEVEYEVLPSVVDEEDALEEGAPPVNEGSNRAGSGRPYQRGDVAQGFAEADVILEETYRTPFELHTPSEPHGCVVRWDGNRLVVWESTQGVFGVQRDMARALGLRLANVRVVGHYVGGAFGSKLGTGKYAVIAALMARKTARPVKLFLTREETMVAGGHRPGARMWLKAGVKRDGTLTALEMKTLGSGGARSRNGIGLVDWQVRDLYRCANVKTGGQNVYINAGDQRPMRAPGHPQGSWALEQMMDALAVELDMDPVELRRRNLTGVSQARGDQPYTSTGFEECLEEGARAFGWGEARRRDESAGPIRRGVGMAGCLWVAGGGGPPSTVIVKFFVDGSANLNMGAADLGTGTKTVMAMVVAEELGVPLESIQIEHADTGTTEYATPSGGSKTVPTDAPAVRAAALDCKEQILRMAGRQLKIDPSQLALAAGAVVRKRNPAKRTPFRKVRGLQRAQVVIGIGYRGENPEGKATCPFGAQFCEVEVNTRTGEVRILRFLAAQDSGRVMNRKTFDNQVYGGITMGIGLGTTERRVLDRQQTGKLVSRSWHDYKIPTALDVPADITSLPVETDSSEANTVGAKGLGEPVTIPTAAAIANAVYDATGVRVTDSPINPTGLLELLQTARESASGKEVSS
jgi:xanthine dehydrogenase YagR molybdenum-binding subunit